MSGPEGKRAPRSWNGPERALDLPDGLVAGQPFSLAGFHCAVAGLLLAHASCLWRPVVLALSRFGPGPLRAPFQQLAPPDCPTSACRQGLGPAQSTLSALLLACAEPRPGQRYFD